MKEIIDYLRKTLDDRAELKEVNMDDVLSLSLSRSYEFYMAEVFKEKFLLIKPLQKKNINQLRNQIALINQKVIFPVVVCVDDMTSYLIKKYIEKKIPFLVPARGMYMPFLGLHFTGKEINPAGELLQRFTPTLQQLFLFILYNEQEEFEQQEIAEQLNISVMTAGRGLEMLKGIGALGYRLGGKTGRKKIYYVENKEKYYEIGKDFLINPIKKTIYVREIPDDIPIQKSGLTALAECSLISFPNHKIMAVYKRYEQQLLKQDVGREVGIEEQLPEIQILKYNTQEFTDTDCVDAITIIQTIEESDERIEMAIDEMMGDYEWYTG